MRNKTGLFHFFSHSAVVFSLFLTEFGAKETAHSTKDATAYHAASDDVCTTDNFLSVLAVAQGDTFDVFAVGAHITSTVKMVADAAT